MGRGAKSSAQLSFGDSVGTEVVVGIEVDEVGAGENRSEGVGGRGVNNINGLVWELTSEVEGRGI